MSQIRKQILNNCIKTNLYYNINNTTFSKNLFSKYICSTWNRNEFNTTSNHFYNFLKDSNKKIDLTQNTLIYLSIILESKSHVNYNEYNIITTNIKPNFCVSYVYNDNNKKYLFNLNPIIINKDNNKQYFFYNVPKRYINKNILSPYILWREVKDKHYSFVENSYEFNLEWKYHKSKYYDKHKKLEKILKD